MVRLDSPSALPVAKAHENVFNGSSNVSFSIRGLLSFFLGGSRALSCCREDFPETSGGLQLGVCGRCCGTSLDNRSCVRPTGSACSTSLRLYGDIVLFTVPRPSYVKLPYVPFKFSLTASNSGDGKDMRAGSIGGADILPIHSTAVVGALIVISCVSNPRLLKTRTFPFCVPIAMRASELWQISLSLSVALSPN